MSFEHVTGTYLLGLEPMHVFELDGRLRLGLTGVPPAFAARLEPMGSGFRLEGGDLDSAEVVFADGDPSPGGTIAGVLEFTRAPAATRLPGGRGLFAPAVELSSLEEARYDRLLESILAEQDGGWLDPGEPRWRFVEWLTAREAVIFHGSPRDDIDVFAPVRTSVEVMDQSGKGNLAAVYGTPFGLWAMWFAVIDRSQLEGTIRNGVIRWSDLDGRTLDLYHFSVHEEYVGGDIWRDGTLYLLPRHTFEASSLFPGGPRSSEWASLEEVRPLKRVALMPDDFPFRDEVGGHDDSELIRAERLGALVLDRAKSARRLASGVEIVLAWDDELVNVFDEYLALTRMFMPDVERRLLRSPNGAATLEISGPEGFLQALEASLAKRGIELELSARDRAPRSLR